MQMGLFIIGKLVSSILNSHKYCKIYIQVKIFSSASINTSNSLNVPI